jgi:hypothetical protein
MKRQGKSMFPGILSIANCQICRFLTKNGGIYRISPVLALIFHFFDKKV